MINDDINLFLGVFSYPFVNVEFLKSDLLQNYYEQGKSGEKEKIRQDVVAFLKRKYHLYSYDEVYLYLDRWYLNRNSDEQDAFEVIWKHLNCFTESFISQRDGKIVYKYWENEHDKQFLGGFSGENKIYLFHSLNRLIPLDILSVIYMVKNCKKFSELNGYYGNIEVSDALLDRVLEKGVAENHLHSGVAVSFLKNWDEYMMPFTDKMAMEWKKITDKAINDERAINSRESAFLMMLANLLRTCILLKVVQLKTLRGDPSRRNDDSERKRISSPLEKQLAYFIKTFHGDLEEQMNYFCVQNDPPKSMAKEFLDRWLSLTRGAEYKDFEVKNIWSECAKEVLDLHTSDENLFLYAVVDFLFRFQEVEKSDGEDYSIVKNLFLNYLRIKNHFYQLVVQEKTIHGLNFFQEEYYRKNSDFRKQVEEIRGTEFWERAIREQVQNENLRKLEFRLSISENEVDFKKNVDSFLKAYLNVLHESYCECVVCDREKEYRPIKDFPRVGLVFHLLKKEQDQAKIDGKIPYEKIYKQYQGQVCNLRRLRNSKNGFVYDKYLLGLDVASLENEVPTWVFANIFENARDSKTEPINKNFGQYQNHQSLSFTFHVGEDYRHLMSGLRRIHEVITYLKFHAGDRIGHGIALGVDPQKWWMNNKTIVIPAVELLDNYIWAYDLLRNHCDSSLLVNLDFIEKRIYELFKEIYGYSDFVMIHTMVEAYHALFKKNMFEEDFFREEKRLLKNYFKRSDTDGNRITDPLTWNVNRLLAVRTCPVFADKMNKPMHIKVEEQEVEIIHSLQKLVKQDVDAKGIIVEICPSSNVAIADLDTVKDHQVYNINGYGYQFDNLIVCINSDDPSVFNTNASNELGYIYFGMLERNTNREAALEWVDKLRKNAMNGSFIRRKDSDLQILRELERFVKNL